MMKDRPANWKDIEGTILFFTVVAILGAAAIYLQDAVSGGTGYLMALAAMACGALLGFLFGLPRALSYPTKAVPGAPLPGADESVPRKASTNLEEIADWLTKILLGAGLTQLGQLPGALQSMASSLTQEPADQAVVIAVWIFFFIFGFVLSYLLARLFVAGAIVTADYLTDKKIMIEGAEYSPQEAMTALHKTVSDLQDHVVNLSAKAGNDLSLTLTEQAKEPGGLSVKSLLWIDHKPPTDPIVEGKLKSLDIEVSVAQRSEAIRISGTANFDRVVVVADSTLDELPILRAFILDFVSNSAPRPLVVFCDPPWTTKLAAELNETQAGVTSSAADLLLLLNLTK